jgi:predicted metal-dependent phosphoesterase TrpH
LHTHSVVSDGTDTPAELVARAAAAGLDVVALTDHDSSAGWGEAAAAARRAGIALVRGAEFSTRCEGHSVHLLAYLYDPDDATIAAELDAIGCSRRERARKMVAKLAADFPITWQDVAAQAGSSETVGRPHMADALVAAGVVPDRSAAFASILRNGSRYYVRHYAPDAARMAAAVVAAGGVPVLAHPGATSRGGVISDDAIASLAAAGLAGIEVWHRDNPPDQRQRLLARARELGLLVTGASDYHGLGKPNRLGENTTSPAALEAITARATAIPLL